MIIAAFVIAMLFMYRAVVAPVRRLTAATQQISLGKAADLGLAKISPNSGNELHRLALATERLRVSINMAIQRLVGEEARRIAARAATARGPARIWYNGGTRHLTSPPAAVGSDVPSPFGLPATGAFNGDGHVVFRKRTCHSPSSACPRSSYARWPSTATPRPRRSRCRRYPRCSRAAICSPARRPAPARPPDSCCRSCSGCPRVPRPR